MKKISIYFIPGLAASPAIFENLKLDPEKYTLHYLKWIKPLSTEEEIGSYTYRLSAKIKEKKPVLIGVSFGGIIVQEMARFVNPKKIIIISSIKNSNEFPEKFKFLKFTKIYKLFPTNVIISFENYAKFFIGKSLHNKATLYKKYLSVRDKLYLKWAISSVLKWKQFKTIDNLVHIHGTKDAVFPIRKIKNVIEIKGGTHSMILTKAKKISKIIDTILAH